MKLNGCRVASMAMVFAACAPAQTDRESALLARIEALEKRLGEVEARLAAQPAPVPAAVAPAALVPAAAAPASTAAPPPVAGLDVNLTLDGYYGYNFNRPVGRVNLLRAYDVLSNSFSLNQATLMLERPPDLAAGRRFGVRLDLQSGRATEAQGGNPSNEPRPQAWRNVFQAYGTYVVPVGKGLAVDFGKWASSLGLEGNYTKDQMNYSRSMLFNFLPFYHFGVRTAYSFNDRFGVGYWLVNGIGQSEDFNGAKSQNVTATVKPAKSLTWTSNYYTGNENPDIVPNYVPGPAALPTQPNLSTETILPAPRGRTHILDSIFTWNANSALTFAGEFDYAVRRFPAGGGSPHLTGGAAYARYQFGPRFALAARGEYINDNGALFSGTPQVLKEATFTADYAPVTGFLIRTEWRRDFSNRPFFLSDVPGVLKKGQSTATVGVIWWFGPHQGAW